MTGDTTLLTCESQGIDGKTEFIQVQSVPSEH